MALLTIMALIFKKKPPFFAYALPSICLCSSSKTHLPVLYLLISLSLNSRLKSLASWHYDYNNFECNGFDICTQNTHTVKKQRTCIPCYYCISHSIPPSPPTTIHILNLSYEIMYSNNEQYCIYI